MGGSETICLSRGITTCNWGESMIFALAIVVQVYKGRCDASVPRRPQEITIRGEAEDELSARILLKTIFILTTVRGHLA